MGLSVLKRNDQLAEIFPSSQPDGGGLAELGWMAVRVRGLTRGGYLEQVRWLLSQHAKLITISL